MQLGQKIKGIDGSITVYENRIEISDKAFTSIWNKYGIKIIFIKDITAIQFVEGRMLNNGAIQFICPGTTEKSHAGLLSKFVDENTIIFPKKLNKEFAEIKDYIISKKV